MGGQACVFYGAAQFSKDIDFAVLGEEENFERLRVALEELQASRIAIPRFDPKALERGHAVHFRCRAPGVQGLRLDVMTRMRGVASFPELWARRTTLSGSLGEEYDLIAVVDLVQAKKTQREKDWPVISMLVEIHYHARQSDPTPEQIAFWLRETRVPERLAELVHRFPGETHSLLPVRPLLNCAVEGDLDALRAAMDTEMREEQARDRVYWEPLRRELEEFRRQERSGAELA